MEASCSVRLLHPFAKLAASRASLHDLVPAEVESLDPDARVPLRDAQGVLSVASERLRDDALGLRLGRSMGFGAGGLFDYVVRSAPTIRASHAVAQRFCALLAAPFAVSLSSHQQRSVVALEDEVPWSRVVAEFALAAFYRIHVRDALPSSARVQCWFPHAAPADTTEYERTFAGAELRFCAPLLGVAFERQCEDAPMPVADAALHAMLCSHAEARLEELIRLSSMTRLVRRMIRDGLGIGGDVTADAVARKLRTSDRTMSRRLEQEGTSFAREVDAARRDHALALVRDTRLPLSDVAFRAGFSHPESFFRAFKRWTGMTPAAYREREPAAPFGRVTS